jgi:hypothetical protein
MRISPLAALTINAFLLWGAPTASATDSELLQLAKAGPNKIQDQGDPEVFQKFFENIQRGSDVQLQSDTNQPNPQSDLSSTDPWDRAPVVKAEWIVWLCTDPMASNKVPPHGINIVGARIVGSVDLSCRKIDFPLLTRNCRFQNIIVLDHAVIASLQLEHTRIAGLHADGLTVNGDILLLNGFYAEGEMWLRNATVHGLLECHRGWFHREAVKQEYLPDLPSALNLRAARIERGLYLFFCSASGAALFDGSQITGMLDCEGSTFNGCFDERHRDNAIFAEGMQVSGDVKFTSLHAIGSVDIKEATIGGKLDCTGGTFANPGEVALDAELLKVGTDLLLRDGFVANGEVNFRGASVGGDFNCNGAHFEGKNNLTATSVKVDGSLLMQPGKKNGARIDFTADGAIDISNAQVARSVELNLPKESTLPTSLDLSSTKTGELDQGRNWPRVVHLDGFSFGLLKGSVPEAKIEEEWLGLRNEADFSSQPYEQMASVLRSMGLRDEAIDVLVEKSWQAGKAVMKADLARLDSLQRATSSIPFWRVDRMVACAAQTAWIGWKMFGNVLWYYFFGYIIGYGYKPEGALIPSIAMVCLGCVLFQSGYNANAIVPSNDEARIPNYSNQTRDSYPRFNAFVYSLEKFVPLLRFELGDYWVPNSNQVYGKVLRVFLWIHIVAGWLLSSLWIGSLTGLLKT